MVANLLPVSFLSILKNYVRIPDLPVSSATWHFEQLLAGPEVSPPLASLNRLVYGDSRRAIFEQ